MNSHKSRAWIQVVMCALFFLARSSSGLGQTIDPKAPLFKDSGLAWNQDISKASLDPQSSLIIGWLNANGGWGPRSLRVDFSLNVLQADASTPFVSIARSANYLSPDCDDGLTQFPLPKGGAAEGSADYSCSDGDCHVLVVDRKAGYLYESYGSNLNGGSLSTVCAIRWNLNKTYSPSLRGDQCVSADVGGLPIAALTFSADEIAAGEIRHALRFALPNNRIASRVFVHPATHAGGSSGPSQAVPYGARFRLKATTDLSALKPSAKIVAKALQTYGMILTDGGNIPLTAVNDAFTVHKWSEVAFQTFDLIGLKVTDFEMIDGRPRIALTNNCVRS
jgi:hypothetical protein